MAVHVLVVPNVDKDRAHVRPYVEIWLDMRLGLDREYWIGTYDLGCDRRPPFNTTPKLETMGFAPSTFYSEDLIDINLTKLWRMLQARNSRLRYLIREVDVDIGYGTRYGHCSIDGIRQPYGKMRLALSVHAPVAPKSERGKGPQKLTSAGR